MRTLLDEAFAPLTSAIGFIDASHDDVAHALISWRQSLSRRVTSRTAAGTFPQVLRALEPLTTIVAPRELLLPTDSAWTAYFESSARGADITSTVPHLTYANHWRGVIAQAIPHTIGSPGIKRGRFGAVQFLLLGHGPTDFINEVRAVGIFYDGRRWEFTAVGTPQPYEQLEVYRERRVESRFTADMLEKYCEALGIRLFDPSFYKTPGVVIETHMVLPAEAQAMTLAEAQRWLEISPAGPRR